MNVFTKPTKVCTIMWLILVLTVIGIPWLTGVFVLSHIFASKVILLSRLFN